MKKLLMLVLVVVLGVSVCAGLVACNEKGDLAKVEKAGKIVVGVTVYPPMDYIDENGEWTGFDAELAQMFADELGVNCQIVIINWKQKVAELNGGQIDLIWNGMTASEELGSEIDFSVAYAKNAQVAVVKSDSTIATKDQIKAATIAVENGSAGNIVASDIIQPATLVPAKDQTAAVNEVVAGTSDVAIIDLTMASSIVGKGEYANLKIVEGVSYGDEIFAVGLRKGSDLKERLDAFLKAKYADGTMARLIEKYSNVVLNEDALK